MFLRDKDGVLLMLYFQGSTYYFSAFIGGHRYCPNEDFLWVNGYVMGYTNWDGNIAKNGTSACAAMGTQGKV